MTRRYKGLHGVTGGYKGLQRVTRGDKGLQGIQGVTRGDKGLQGIQGVTRGYKGLQILLLLQILSSNTMMPAKKLPYNVTPVNEASVQH